MSHRYPRSARKQLRNATDASGYHHDNQLMEEVMGIGVSILFIAIGAILTFALDTNSTEGFNLDMIGIILMVVGGIGLLAFLTVLGSWGGRRGDGDVVVR